MASLEDPGELKKSARTFHCAGCEVRLFGKFAGGAHHKVLTLNVQEAGRDFPQVHAHGMAVLLDEQYLTGSVHRQHSHGARVVDVVAGQGFAGLAELEAVADNVPDPAFVDLFRRQKTARARCIRNLLRAAEGVSGITGHRAVL